MKKPKASKEWHGSKSKFGMGDYYGSGVRNPIGRVRDSYINTPSKNINKPPKSLA